MKSLRLLVLVLMLSMGLVSVKAQDATPETTASGDTNLVYGVAAQGTITNEAFTQAWTLATASADRVTIRVERTDGNLIPDVSVLDASGTAITGSYGADRTGAVSLINNYTLPAAGTYTVQVGRYGADTGATTGSYTVTVTPLATGEDNPNNTVVLSEVTTDAPVSGEITGSRWLNRYTFNAQGADNIQVSVKRTAGSLIPQVDILDANGASLTTGYSNFDDSSAQIDSYTLSAAGAYSIVVSRYSGFNGDTVGTYDLSVKVLGYGADNPAMQGTAGAITYDTDVQGTIGAQWYQDWTLTAAAGDTISITATRTSGSLQPQINLLGGSSQVLIGGYADNTYATANIDHYTLTGPGTYTVRVGRASDQSGETAGDYNLHVTLEGTGADSAALNTPAGAVESGQTVNGTITNAAWTQTWTINGTQGVVVDISVTRTSGTFIPVIEIRDANGQPLRTGYYGDTQDSATIDGYALPGTGEYQIVVYRDGQQNGYTSGDYELTVKPTG